MTDVCFLMTCSCKSGSETCTTWHEEVELLDKSVENVEDIHKSQRQTDDDHANAPVRFRHKSLGNSDRALHSWIL